MLVLSRKLGEKLYIGDDICITIVRLSPGRVGIGIEAPRSLTILRDEQLKIDMATTTPDGRIPPKGGSGTAPSAEGRRKGRDQAR